MIQLTNNQKILLATVQEIFEEDNIYLVGGAVRDIILGIEPKDYDFCIGNNVEQIEASIKSSGRRAYLTGKRFGTIGCKVEVEGKQYMIEVTQFRSEVYQYSNRKPEVKFVDNLTADLSRRDFTINAMAIRCDNYKLIDLFYGRKDLKNNILRAVGNPKIRFSEDPLRILRGIRFAAIFNLDIETKTREKLEHCVPRLLDISKERWVQELDNILMLQNPYCVLHALDLLWETKIFNYIIPELALQYKYGQNSPHHSFSLSYHTSRVVMATPLDINLRWAALLHDIAKPFVRTEKKIIYKMQTNDGSFPIDGYETRSNYINHDILGAEIVEKLGLYLKWSNERTEIVKDLVKNHLNENCVLREYDNLGKK